MNRPDFRGAVAWTGSFEKMAEVLAFKDWLTHADWLQLLGMFWNEFDNIRDYRLELRRILGTGGPLRGMMDWGATSTMTSC